VKNRILFVYTKDDDYWQKRYSAGERIFGDKPCALLVDHTQLFNPGMSALCIADGEGRNSVWLAKQGLRVTAMDVAPAALAKTQAWAEKNGVTVETQCADVNDWLWQPDAFDFVICVYLQLPPEYRCRLHQGMVKTCKAGGYIFIEAYHREHLKTGLSGPKDIDFYYHEELIRQDFSEFEIMLLQKNLTTVDENDPTQKGVCLEFVGRKP